MFYTIEIHLKEGIPFIYRQKSSTNRTEAERLRIAWGEQNLLGDGAAIMIVWLL